MNRSLVTIANHSREKIEYLLQMAQEFERHPNRLILQGRVVATLFFEPSTRTRLSFETAANRLGARVIGFADPKVTSATPSIRHRGRSTTSTSTSSATSSTGAPSTHC